MNYLAAGERLNVAHPLYALVGRPSGPHRAAYRTSPLLSPPPIAVFWRPLALIGGLAALVGAATGIVAVSARREATAFRARVVGAALGTPAFCFAPLGLLVAMLVNDGRGRQGCPIPLAPI